MSSTVLSRQFVDSRIGSDRHTFDLLHQLTPEGSPTFYTYTIPPQDVLDLGCGQGFWAEEAVKQWPSSHVTAFDIVDLGRVVRKRLSPELSAHVLWLQGNL